MTSDQSSQCCLSRLLSAVKTGRDQLLAKNMINTSSTILDIEPFSWATGLLMPDGTTSSTRWQALDSWNHQQPVKLNEGSQDYVHIYS